MRSLLSQSRTPTEPRRSVGFFRSGRLAGRPARLITQSTSGRLCRESNPGPTAVNQDFSGRSLLVAFSAPVLTQTSHRQAQPLLVFPTGPATGPVGGVSLRCQTPVRRRYRADRVATRLRRRGRTQCAWCWHLLVCGHRIYEVTTTTLGPLLLVRLPQSKPVTPMLSCQTDAEAPTTDRTSTTPMMPT